MAVKSMVQEVGSFEG